MSSSGKHSSHRFKVGEYVVCVDDDKGGLNPRIIAGQVYKVLYSGYFSDGTGDCIGTDAPKPQWIAERFEIAKEYNVLKILNEVDNL